MSFRAPDTLIIGYGNPLRSDDAAGLRVARELAAAGYRVIETHQLVPELAEDVAGVRRVIFIDCDAGCQPGEVRVSRVDAHSQAGTHVQAPGDILRLAADLYEARPAAFLIGVGPQSLDLGETLSPAVEQAIPQAVAAVSGILAPGGS